MTGDKFEGTQMTETAREVEVCSLRSLCRPKDMGDVSVYKMLSLRASLRIPDDTTLLVRDRTGTWVRVGPVQPLG